MDTCRVQRLHTHKSSYKQILIFNKKIANFKTFHGEREEITRRIKYLEHFGDEHQLKLIDEVDDRDDLALCKACEKDCHPYYYSCSICDFNLHDSCANLDTFVLHRPLHPHYLDLFHTGDRGAPDRFQCEVCSRNIDGASYGYTCKTCKDAKLCDFYVDVHCALLRPTIKEDALNHVAHVHPLVLVATDHVLKDVGDDFPRCHLCWELIIVSSIVFYSCEPCRFYLHKSCAELQLPKDLRDHFYHHCFPGLTLCTKRNSYNCGACLRNRNGLHYRCRACNFRMDVECTLLPDKLKSEGQELHYHSMHGHPLALVDVNEDEDNRCVACQKTCSAETYVCLLGGICKFFLHKSCFNLRRQISHPYDPDLTLDLTPECYPKARCNICSNLCSCLFYCLLPDLSKKKCKETSGRSFNLHVKCPVELSIVTYEAHPHDLVFIENIDGNNNEFKGMKCSICGKDCISSSPLFGCAKCNYRLHVECGPLPILISFKSELHTHPLRLAHSPVVWEHEQQTDVFHCDECEKVRDPRLSVYVCSEGCSYTAEIKCVISEVKLALLGNYGEVELMCLITKKAGRVISRYQARLGQDQELGKDSGKIDKDCNKIIDRITKKDTDLHRSIYKAAQLWDQSAATNSKEETALFPNDAHHLIKLLYRGKEIFEEDVKIFKVDDNFVMSDFKYLREAVVDVIPAESTLPDSLEDYFRFLLCWTLNSMCTTRVVDISQELLSRWWKILKMVHFAGFNIQFALDRLDRVVFAYYGLQVKVENENLENLATEITELDQDIKKSEAILLDKKARLRALQKRHENAASKEMVNSSLIHKCLGEASELKWRVAGEGLLDK